MPTKPKVDPIVESMEDEDQSKMKEMVRRVLLASIGAVVIAQEEIEALINRLVEKGEIAEKDGKAMMHEMMDKRKKNAAKTSDDISKNLEGVLEKMKIPSKADFDNLSQKITDLSKKVDDLKKP